MTTLVERHNAKARRDVEKRQSGGMSRAEGWRRRGPLLPALIFTIIVTQVPFLFTIWYSLQNWNLLNPEGDRFVWFSNYVEIFADSTFRQAALNSVIFTLGCVFFAMILGIIFALLLDRSFAGRGIVRTLLITPFLIMPVAGSLLWSVSILNPSYGLLNWLIGKIGRASCRERVYDDV